MALETLAPDCSKTELLAALERDGACIVRDLLPPDRLDRIVDETAPWIERSNLGADAFSGRRTKRTGALVARSPACREAILDPLVLDSARAFLGPYAANIQLHLTQTIAIYPGQEAQLLHRDRLAWGGYIPKPIEPQLNTIWALTDFTAENGATRVVPGSHAWPLDRDAKPEDPIQAEMRAGSVLVYSGTLIHGGGANRSDAVRIGLNITYCLGWLRQEENQYLSCPPEIAKTLPPELSELVGYTMGQYALGYYTDPRGTGEGTDTAPPEAALGRRPRKGPGLALGE